jgi:hypothetical protein
LNRMFLRTILAAFAAIFTPMIAICQAAPAEGAASAKPEPTYKYEAYAGFGYSSLNQVNQSRYGLMGVDLSITRDFGKYFGLSAMGNYYKPPLGGGNGTNGNPGDPSIYEVLAGPELHAVIYDRVSGFFHGGLGVEHTGGEEETPSLSFAGGFGGGLIYNINSRFGVRASGDRIGAAFSLRNNSTELGNSPHRTWNSSATIGVIYHF